MARSARGGAAPRNAKAAARTALLLLVAVMVLLAAAARYQGDVNAARDVYFGAVLGFGLLLVSGWVTFPLARMLDAEVPLVVIGIGPIVRRGVGRQRMTVLRLLPISLFYLFGAGRARFRRDMRLLVAVGLATPLVLALALAPLLPGYAALAAVLTVLWFCLVRLAQRNAVLECTGFAFLFRRPTPQDEQRLLAVADTWHAFYAVSFGDAAAAERLLPGVLPRVAAPIYGARALQELLHEIRGDYEAAWRTLRSYPAEHAGVARLDDVRLRLLEAERNPSKAPSALAAADAYLGGAQHGQRPADRGKQAAALALHRLEQGRPSEARACVRTQLRFARTPLRYADALCNRARIEAASGRLERAGRTLRLAHSVAPWYARIAVVRGRIGFAAGAPGTAADAAPVRDMTELARSSPDTPEDPWAAPGA